MKDVKALYERLRAMPWPALASRVGDFALYESLLVGCVDRVASGRLLDTSKVPNPDNETVVYVASLRKKPGQSHEETAFLEYFDLLVEIRSALAGDGSSAMEILRFNEQALMRDLERLPPPFRTAFAATVAERLLPAYEHFARRTGRGDSAKLVAILQRLWLDLEGNGTSAERNDDIAVCMNLIPQEDSGAWIAEQAYAEDAAAALAYALRSRKTGAAQEAAWAGRRAYEALDHFIIAQEDIDTNEEGAELRVLSHPLVQAELSRQRRDVSELMNKDNLVEVVDRLRKSAKAEAETVFKFMETKS
jgi:uncharacterized protein YjaG (DUF416 family)